MDNLVDVKFTCEVLLDTQGDGRELPGNLVNQNGLDCCGFIENKPWVFTSMLLNVEWLQHFLNQDLHSQPEDLERSIDWSLF